MEPRRLAIGGGPRSGKTTLSADYPNALHTDDVMGLGWSEASATVATWFDREGELIVEGVAVPRALRKWMDAHPEGKPVDELVWLRGARTPLAKGQESMRKGAETVFAAIARDLEKRGVRVTVKEVRPAPAPSGTGGGGIEKAKPTQPLPLGVKPSNKIVSTLRFYRAIVQEGIGQDLSDPHRWEDRVDWTRAVHGSKIRAYAAIGGIEAAARKKGLTGIRRLIRKDDAEDSSMADALSFTIDNPYAQKWARERAGQLITSIDSATRKTLRAYVEAALREGTAPYDLASQLRQIAGLRKPNADMLLRMAARLQAEGKSQAEIDGLIKARSDYLFDERCIFIARSETAIAQTQGLLNSWDEAKSEGLLPATAVKVWLATIESPTLSDACRELHGKMVPLGQSFHSSVLGQNLDGPPHHPFCRSTLGLKVLTQAEFDRL